jgi:hypothetical protein
MLRSDIRSMIHGASPLSRVSLRSAAAVAPRSAGPFGLMQLVFEIQEKYARISKKITQSIIDLFESSIAKPADWCYTINRTGLTR